MSAPARPQRFRKGGWAIPGTLPRGENGRPLCRWCNREVPRGRRTFCSQECVHEWRIRTDPSYLREQVLARDRGVCAICGIDTVALRKDMRKLDFRARKRFLREWRLREGFRRTLCDGAHTFARREG